MEENLIDSQFIGIERNLLIDSSVVTDSSTILLPISIVETSLNPSLMRKFFKVRKCSMEFMVPTTQVLSQAKFSLLAVNIINGVLVWVGCFECALCCR